MDTGLHKKGKVINFLKSENIYLLGVSKFDFYLEANIELRLRNLNYIIRHVLSKLENGHTKVDYVF